MGVWASARGGITYVWQVGLVGRGKGHAACHPIESKCSIGSLTAHSCSLASHHPLMLVPLVVVLNYSYAQLQNNAVEMPYWGDTTPT